MDDDEFLSSLSPDKRRWYEQHHCSGAPSCRSNPSMSPSVLEHSLLSKDWVLMRWLCREGLFARIYDRASHMVTEFLAVLGSVHLCHDFTLAFYFDEIKHEAQSHLYLKEVEFEGRSKDGKKHTLRKADALRMAAQRLAYREDFGTLDGYEVEHENMIPENDHIEKAVYMVIEDMHDIVEPTQDVHKSMHESIFTISNMFIGVDVIEPNEDAIIDYFLAKDELNGWDENSM
ncbi:hypothetical protein L7F22_002873 [Adiantum nelumboides]|nr:hypothetical protein [Adiantum nelumboides]